MRTWTKGGRVCQNTSKIFQESIWRSSGWKLRVHRELGTPLWCSTDAVRDCRFGWRRAAELQMRRTLDTLMCNSNLNWCLLVTQTLLHTPTSGYYASTIASMFARSVDPQKLICIHMIVPDDMIDLGGLTATLSMHLQIWLYDRVAAAGNSWYITPTFKSSSLALSVLRASRRILDRLCLLGEPCHCTCRNTTSQLQLCCARSQSHIRLSNDIQLQWIQGPLTANSLSVSSDLYCEEYFFCLSALCFPVTVPALSMIEAPHYQCFKVAVFAAFDSRRSRHFLLGHALVLSS